MQNKEVVHVDFRIQPPTVVSLLSWESFGTVFVGNVVAMESQAATLSPENLASLYYTLAENELSPVESLEILRNVWRVSDPQYPKLNKTLLEQVASLLNYRYAEQRAQFLDLFGYFRYLAEYLCWDFPITTEILQHSLKDLTPPKEQNFTILWGLDLAHVLAGLVGLGKGGTRRGQMQLIALRNLVFETMDSHQVSPDFSKNLTVCCILMTLLALVIVPILLLCMFGWSLLTLDWRFVKLRKRVRSHVPQISLRRWHWVLIVGLGVGFVWIGLIAVEPYRGELKDHASRVLRLYLTLAIARLAPILTRIASYWEAYRTVIEFLKGRRPYKVVMLYILWFLVAAFVVQPRVNFWARTMKARIPILEAQVHLELWKLGRLPGPVSWDQMECKA